MLKLLSGKERVLPLVVINSILATLFGFYLANKFRQKYLELFMLQEKYENLPEGEKDAYKKKVKDEVVAWFKKHVHLMGGVADEDALREKNNALSLKTKVAELYLNATE